MKFLLFAHTGLGNFILKTPLIRAIHENFQNPQVDLVCGTPWGVEHVLKEGEWIRQIHWCYSGASTREKLQCIRNIRRQEYDVVICPFDATPSWLFQATLLMRSRKVVAHIDLMRLSWKGRIRFSLLQSSRRYLFVPVLTGRHETDLNLDLLEPFLQKPTERNYQTFIHQTVTDLSRFDLPDEYIVVQLTARNGQATPKTWDPDNFSKVIRQVRVQRPSTHFIFVGDKGDAESLQETTLIQEGVINLMGKTSFNELCNVILNARGVLAHDSGIMHMANALQRPLVALYGPTDFTRTAPRAPTSNILYSRNECWARMYGFRASEDALADEFPSFYCMSGIKVSEVVDRLVAMK